jgi:hypothetical protein
VGSEPEYSGHFEVRCVNRNGGMRWHNRWVIVSHVRAEGRFDEYELRIQGAHDRNELHDR